jgi:hypothetical protein
VNVNVNRAGQPLRDLVPCRSLTIAGKRDRYPDNRGNDQEKTAGGQNG